MADLTRRRVLTLTGTTVLGGTALLTASTGTRATADVSMGSLDISGDSQALQDAPSAVTLEVTGSWELTGTEPDQARCILQVEFNSTSRDLDEVMELDSPMSGNYTLSSDLLAHPEVDASALLPSEIGATADSTFTIRVILLAISSGEIQQETYVQDTATLSLTKDGLTLEVGGSGSISVSA